MPQHCADQYAVALYIVTPSGVVMVRDESKPPPFWKLPGGRSQESDASPDETAIRETMEETGLIIPRNLLVYVNYENRHNHTFILYSATLPSSDGLLEVGNEGEQVRLASVDEIRKMTDYFPPHKKLLQENKLL